MWRPLYLQCWVLVSFTITFTVLVAILEALLVISDQNNGLASPPEGRQYIWKFAPTVVLTIIALGWDRVTFQTQMLAPWHRMQKSKTIADKSVVLDYLDMFPPTAIISALKNDDWAPAAALSVSLLLQVLVILSTSFLDLRITQIESAVPIELRNQFHSAGTDDLMRAADVAYYTILDMSDVQSPYPEGTTAQYAYQTLSHPPDLGTRLRVNADGLIATLDCKEAAFKLLNITTVFSPTGDEVLALITFEVQEGNYSIETTSGIYINTVQYTSLYFVRVLSRHCSNQAATTENKTVIVMGRLDYTKENAINNLSGINISHSTQVICVPEYEIKTVTLVQNGTSFAVEEARPKPERDLKTLENITGNSFVLAQKPPITPSIPYNLGSYNFDLHDGLVLNMDNYTAAVQGSELSQASDSELTDATLWLDAVARYFQKFSAQIAHNSLLKRDPIMVTVIRRQEGKSLLVARPICHSMAALLGLCALHSIAIIFTVPRHSSLDTNPTSILGTAWMAREATSLILRLRDQGLGKPKVIQGRLHNAVYMLIQPSRSVFRLVADSRSSQIRPNASTRPAKPRQRGKYTLVLHPVSRTMFSLSLIGSIIALEVLLRVSQQNDGLGSAILSYYLQYSWTVLPSIFFTAMALTASSINTATMSLVPFLNLGRGGSLSQTVALDLLDRSIPLLFFKGVRLRSWIVVLAITASSISSLFTLFSGSLYMNRYFPVHVGTQLRANTTFAINETSTCGATLDQIDTGLKGMGASSLILGLNSSFKPFTYKDLVFPSLTIDGPSLMNVEEHDTSSIAIQASVPAIRTRLQCMIYGEEQIQTTFIVGPTATALGLPAWPNHLRIEIDGEGCEYNGYYTAGMVTIPLNTEEGEVTFGASGAVSEKDGKSWRNGCSTILYVWGRVTVDLVGDSTVTAFALGCNETIETVDTEVHFNTATWMIDSSNPPVANENSILSVIKELQFPHEEFYQGLASSTESPPSQNFDDFFALLTTSPWALPIADLANTSAVDKVVASIKAQHGLIRANHINENCRVPVNNSSPDVAPILYNANATVLPGKYRVVQDTQSTRVLEGLLAATMVFSLLAWHLMPPSNIIIGSPTSIARKLALAAGGNLFEKVLPRGTDGVLCSDDCVFVLGWRSPSGSTNKPARYGIWALTPEEAETMKSGEKRTGSETALLVGVHSQGSDYD